MPAATAATPRCGSSCTALPDQASGHGYVTSVAVSGLDRRDLTTTIVLASAGLDTSEDFVQEYEGTVAQFYGTGLISAAMDQTWPADSVYEYEYAPGGRGSEQCIAVPSTAVAGTVLTLGTCGQMWAGKSVSRCPAGPRSLLPNGRIPLTGHRLPPVGSEASLLRLPICACPAWGRGGLTRHDVILHRLFSHPFPNTGSRSRSIARKVPSRTSPTCWATVVRAVTSLPYQGRPGLVLAVGSTRLGQC